MNPEISLWTETEPERRAGAMAIRAGRGGRIPNSDSKHGLRHRVIKMLREGKDPVDIALIVGKKVSEIMRVKQESKL